MRRSQNRLVGPNVLAYSMDPNPTTQDRWSSGGRRTGWGDIPTQPQGFDNTMGWPGLAPYRKIQTGIGGFPQDLEVWTPCWTTDHYLRSDGAITLPMAEGDKGHTIADAVATLDARFPVPTWALAIDEAATGWVACYGHSNRSYYGAKPDKLASQYNWLGLVRLPAPLVGMPEVEQLISRDLDNDEDENDDAARPLAAMIGPDGVFVHHPTDDPLDSLEDLPLRWVRVNSVLVRLVVDYKAPKRREAARKGRLAGEAKKADSKKRHDALRDAVGDLAEAAKARAALFLPRACDVNVSYSSWRDDTHTPSSANVARVLEAYDAIYGLDALRKIPAFGVAAKALLDAADEYDKRDWNMPHDLLTMLRDAKPGKWPGISSTPLRGGQLRCRDCNKEGPASTFVLPARLRALWLRRNVRQERPPAVCPRCGGTSHIRSEYEGPIALNEDGDAVITYDWCCTRTHQEAEYARAEAAIAAEAAAVAAEVAATVEVVQRLQEPGEIADAIVSDLRAAVTNLEALAGAVA